jgi:hypothetical protein
VTKLLKAVTRHSRTEQAGYHATFSKVGPFWVWRGWHDVDLDEHSKAWGCGVHLSKQSAIWAARRKMIGRIVAAHARTDHSLMVDGDELVELADADKTVGKWRSVEL